MNRVLAASLLALCVASPLTVRAQALPSDQIDRIIAVVDEDVILQSELDRSLANITAQFADRGGDLPPRDVLERQVLERLINIRVQIARAEQTGIVISDDEVNAAVERVAAQNQLSVDQLRQSLARDGFTFEEFRRTLREEITVQRFRSRFVQSRVQVTDTEVDILLASDSMKTGEVRLSHLLVGLPDGASPDAVEAARSKVEKIKAEISGGLSFSDAAVRYSDGQQALEGGDLGWRRFEQVPSAFADVVGQMKKGDISEPMRGPNGFHLLFLADTREAQPLVVREFKGRHIVVQPSELLSEEKAEERIRALKKRLDDGADFAELAKQYSDDKNTGSLGGDLGWFMRDDYGSGVASAVEALADGATSEPFRTELGWHILQREGSRERDRTADYRRNQARETLVNRKAEEEYDKFIRQMRAEAYIENRMAG